MTGNEGEQIMGGWLIDKGARLLIDVRSHPFYIKWHIDFILATSKVFMLECKTDENIARTNNFCFETARIYLNSQHDYHAWGLYSKADSMLVYSPQKHEVFKINSLPKLRNWITPQQVRFASPVASRLSHKDQTDKNWEKVTYNWLINIDKIIDAKLGRWYKMTKTIAEYSELFQNSNIVTVYEILG